MVYWYVFLQSYGPHPLTSMKYLVQVGWRQTHSGSYKQYHENVTVTLSCYRNVFIGTFGYNFICSIPNGNCEMNKRVTLNRTCLYHIWKIAMTFNCEPWRQPCQDRGNPRQRQLGSKAEKCSVLPNCTEQCGWVNKTPKPTTTAMM